MLTELSTSEKHEVPFTGNMVLIGYRATGKSTTAARLGEILGRQVISTDAEVERRAGKKIKDIVAEYGWDYFRDLESQVCLEVSLRDGVIIDSGGGAILRSENRVALAGNAVVILFTASNETIAQRIGKNDARPSLTGAQSAVDEVAEVMRVRGHIYHEMTSHVINTDELEIEAAVQTVLTILEETERDRIVI